MLLFTPLLHGGSIKSLSVDIVPGIASCIDPHNYCLMKPLELQSKSESHMFLWETNGLRTSNGSPDPKEDEFDPYESGYEEMPDNRPHWESL
jgi:hypothetical protein